MANLIDRPRPTRRRWPSGPASSAAGVAADSAGAADGQPARAGIPARWSQASGYRAEAGRAGSWTCLIARCPLSVWVQRAPQPAQKMSGWKPNRMVMGADPHRAQRGMRTSRVVLDWVAPGGTDGRRAMLSNLCAYLARRRQRHPHLRCRLLHPCLQHRGVPPVHRPAQWHHLRPRLAHDHPTRPASRAAGRATAAARPEPSPAHRLAPHALTPTCVPVTAVWKQHASAAGRRTPPSPGHDPPRALVQGQAVPPSIASLGVASSGVRQARLGFRADRTHRRPACRAP